MRPDVTIVLPVHDGMPFLPEALQSILQQTAPALEVLAIDDGSTDGSASYLASISDRRLRVISQECRGLPATMNRGIEEASGRMIARLDQDDISLPNRLHQQLSYLRTNRVDCVFSTVHRIGRTRTWTGLDKIGTDTARGLDKVYDPWVDGSVCHSTMMCSRDALMALGGYRPECYPADDLDLCLRLSERYVVHLMGRSTVRYRLHSGANSFARFWEMQDKRRWVEQCARSRRVGQTEPRLDEFDAQMRRFRLKALNRRRKDAAQFLVRKGGQLFLDGHYVAGVSLLALSGPVSPLRLMARIAKAARNRLSSADVALLR